MTEFDDDEPTDADIELLERRVADLERQLAEARTMADVVLYPSSNASTPASSVMSADEDEFQDREYMQTPLATPSAASPTRPPVSATSHSNPNIDAETHRRYLELQAENTALWAMYRQLGLPRPGTITNGSNGCHCPVCDSELHEAQRRRSAAPPKIDLKDTMRQLEQIPSLRDETVLIQAFVDAFKTGNNGHSDPTLMLQNVVKAKTHLLDVCKTEEDQKLVMDILDRGRKQNMDFTNEIIGRIKDLSVETVQVELDETTKKTIHGFKNSHTSDACLESIHEIEWTYSKNSRKSA
ncbi:UNVERIFIED_CONTAM: hypothetical protein HDU68_004452 [Siphonaria sp. JEL0065]|nr:hypothetical protein HDU68_004452 [Siphonaria sp. JEL0065]